MTKDKTSRTDDDKRLRIIDAAAKLFGERAFHKVLLSDVAAEARVGKGTLYLYFESKEELFFSVLLQGFSKLVDRLAEDAVHNVDAPADEQLGAIVREMAHRIHGKSSCAHLLRGTVVGFPTGDEWTAKRDELRGLIEAVIRRGVSQGVFDDPHPELSAQFIPGVIRSVRLLEPEGSDLDAVARHAERFVLRGLGASPKN